MSITQVVPAHDVCLVESQRDRFNAWCDARERDTQQLHRTSAAESCGMLAPVLFSWVCFSCLVPQWWPVVMGVSIAGYVLSVATLVLIDSFELRRLRRRKFPEFEGRPEMKGGRECVVFATDPSWGADL